ncbi:MAG: UDP-N-acetylglucosamine 2-epimerase, partial [Nitrospinae bacterium]|nr:UDP-N-acetylglucosamine 2-epimerase [Nitrospinota bacterium]
SDYLFCPSEMAVQNLLHEGIGKSGIGNGKVYNTGDVMYDSILFYQNKAKNEINLEKYDVEKNEFILAMIHRAENTNDLRRLKSIISALKEISKDVKVLFPLHPRTRKIVEENDVDMGKLALVEPTPYLDMISLIMNSKAIVTDSGGVQKEAFFLNTPCITARDETEWKETVKLGSNILCGASKTLIIKAWNQFKDHKIQMSENPYGNGRACQKIIKVLLEQLSTDSEVI